MAKAKKLALFLPRTNPFYTALFFAMKRGFERCGLEVIGWTELPAEETLLELIRQFQPDVIFEMNRTRNDIPGLPATIKHVAWIVDTNGRPIGEFSGSEIIYFIGAPWVESACCGENTLVDWLAPGTDPDHYYPGAADNKTDFSFIGHMPLPWSEDEPNRLIWQDDQHQIRFGQLVKNCERLWQSINLTGFDNDRYLATAEKILSDLAGENIEISDRVIRYDLGCRAVRTMNRASLIEQLLSFTDSLSLYGPDNWCAWERFAPYYNSFLQSPDEMRLVYQQSHLNLHEGVGMHFRSIDCMASGSVLFYRSGPDDQTIGGINNYFEAGQHFISFTPEAMEYEAQALLTDRKRLHKMGQEAAREVHTHHTWQCRAEQVLADLATLS